MLCTWNMQPMFLLDKNRIREVWSERNKKHGENRAAASPQAMQARGSWGGDACYTETSALKDGAWEWNGSGDCCLGSEGEQWGWTEMQVSSGRNDKMLDMACESPAWFPWPRYALEKSLVKLEDQTDIRFTLSGVMSVF